MPETSDTKSPILVRYFHFIPPKTRKRDHSFQQFDKICIRNLKWKKEKLQIILLYHFSWNVNFPIPGCQFVRKSTPREYRCFCNKVVDPAYERGRETPHSCGEMCGKPLKTTTNVQCNHKCVELCHPGPCPPCVASVLQ